MKTTLQLKRVYEPAKADDGTRVLVDRLWPRGVTKQEAAVDVWLKAVAPTPELRKWFGHQPERFSEFSFRYRTELDDNAAVDELLRLLADNKTVTLLYAASDPVHNHAQVLVKYVGERAQ